MTLALIVTLAGVMMLLSFGVGLRRPALTLMAFFLIVSHLSPILSAWIATQAQGTPSGSYNPYQLTAINIAALSAIIFAFGYGAAKRSLPIFRRDDASIQQSINSQSYAYMAPIRVAHFSSIAIVAALILIQPLGLVGFAKLTMTRVPFEGFIYSIIYVAACINALTCCAWMIVSLRAGKSVPWISIALSTLLFFALGGRVQLSITALAYVLAYAAHRRIKAAPLIVLFTIIAVLFNATLLIRLTLQGGQGLSYADTLLLNVAQASALDGYAFADRFVRELGHKPLLYIDSLRLLVPRVFDPDKPEQLSRMMRLMVSRDRLGGLTNGVFGEFYVIGGYYALAIGSFTYGALLGFFDWAFQRAKSLSFLSSALVFIMIPILTLYVTRGGLDVAIFRITTVLFAVGAGLMAMSLFRPALAKKRSAAHQQALGSTGQAGLSK